METLSLRGCESTPTRLECGLVIDASFALRRGFDVGYESRHRPLSGDETFAFLTHTLYQFTISVKKFFTTLAKIMS
jgi:hypothetical protein